MIYPSSLTEETYDELNMLMREMAYDSDIQRPIRRVNIASGDDLFNEQGDHLYATPA